MPGQTNKLATTLGTCVRRAGSSPMGQHVSGMRQVPALFREPAAPGLVAKAHGGLRNVLSRDLGGACFGDLYASSPLFLKSSSIICDSKAAMDRNYQ